MRVIQESLGAEAGLMLHFRRGAQLLALHGNMLQPLHRRAQASWGGGPQEIAEGAGIVARWAFKLLFLLKGQNKIERRGSM